MRWLDHKRRIAVGGLAGSGKTVFLLSLLQHLEHFDPQCFRPASGGEISGFRELPIRNGFEPFPRKRLRAKLMEEQGLAWPKKTRDIYRCRCSFNYSGLGLPTRLWNALRIHRRLDSTAVEWIFLDFPGERLSDAFMIRFPSFETWSDHLLDMWESDERLGRGMHRYLETLKTTDSATVPSLLAAYKHCLARMVRGKNQLITPSTFILDHAGAGVFSVTDAENGGADRPSGLPGREFAPLSAAFRGACPGIAAEFSRHFAEYRETVAKPLFDAINHCDRLLLLVDIPGILSGGVGRFNDTSCMIETLGGILTPSGWFFTNVDKAAFIATKSDMVHRRDLDSLKALLDDMMRLAKNRQPSIGYESFVVSAWVSAESVDLDDGGRALRGIPARDNEIRTFRVPELLPEWPRDWGPEDPRYSYPLLSPLRLANRYLAPEQRNLDKVFDFLIS